MREEHQKHILFHKNWTSHKQRLIDSNGATSNDGFLPKSTSEVICREEAEQSNWE